MADTQAPTLFDFDKDIGEQEAPEPLPLGTYKATIRNVEAKPAKKDPNVHNAEVTFYIPANEYPIDFVEGDPEGITLRYYVSLANKPASRFGLRKFCESIGAPLGRQIDLTQWLGLDAMVKVVHEPYEGRDLAKIDRGGISPA